VVHSNNGSVSKSRRWRALLVVGALALAMGAGACGDDSDDSAAAGSEGSSEPFRVYASLSLSGPLAVIGEAERHGLEASAEQLNQNGGINGREVVLDIVDDGTDPTQAVSLLQRKVNSDEKPQLVWPGTTSNVTLALCPVLMQNEILGLGITASSDIGDLDQCGYNFVMGPTPAESQGAVAEAMAERGYKRVAVLLSNDAYGTAVEAAVKEAFPAAGLEITKITKFAPDALDATPQLRELRGTDPDALFVEGQGAAIGKVLESRHQLGWDVPTVGGTGFGGSNVAALVGQDSLDGVIMWQWGIGVEGHEPFADRWQDTALPLIEKRAGGELKVASNLYAGGYDALMVAAAAAKAADSTEPAKLREALQGFADSPPQDADWVMLSEYPYTSEKNFSGLVDGDFALALPRKLNERGQVPPATEEGE
jgi:branched-chain amino acid transport system substrate-binding protein